MSKVEVEDARGPKARPVVALPAGTEALLGIREVAAALGVTTRHVQHMLAAGEYPGPDLRIGRHPRWTVSTHNGWLKRRCRPEGG